MLLPTLSPIIREAEIEDLINPRLSEAVAARLLGIAAAIDLAPAIGRVEKELVDAALTMFRVHDIERQAMHEVATIAALERLDAAFDQVAWQCRR